jgi:rubrerythrin
MHEPTDATRLGANRTGLQMSPLHSREMTENLDADLADDAADGQALADERHVYIVDADPLGSIPAPATLKGLVKSGGQLLSGHRPQAFLDKLGERLAFERGGVRLYDAVIAKYQAHGSELRGASLQDFLRIRQDEASHALLVVECIEQLGADPTVQTPSADVVGVQTLGLLQAASDPRTTLAQTLQVALSAELVDNAGWEMLTSLAEEMRQNDMVTRFRSAAIREAEHLATVRKWCESLVLAAGKIT